MAASQGPESREPQHPEGAQDRYFASNLVDRPLRIRKGGVGYDLTDRRRITAIECESTKDVRVRQVSCPGRSGEAIRSRHRAASRAFLERWWAGECEQACGRLVDHGRNKALARDLEVDKKQ